MSTRFVHVARVEDVPPGRVLVVSHGRERVALVNAGGEIHALATACSHAGASLAKGRVVDGTLECPLHQSRFDVRTGRHANPPATDPVRVYTVEVDGDRVLVEVED
jgi:3-phenylpropionate/trans-cinnamate dioxygenase ferredoxin subunit